MGKSGEESKIADSGLTEKQKHRRKDAGRGVTQSACPVTVPHSARLLLSGSTMSKLTVRVG